jgi:hypothetical protein
VLKEEHNQEEHRKGVEMVERKEMEMKLEELKRKMQEEERERKRLEEERKKEQARLDRLNGCHSSVEKYLQTPLTTQDYSDLDVNSKCYKKWLELGPLSLQDIIHKSPNGTHHFNNNQFKKVDDYRWSQVGANGKDSGVYRYVSSSCICEGEI